MACLRFAPTVILWGDLRINSPAALNCSPRVFELFGVFDGLVIKMDLVYRFFVFLPVQDLNLIFARLILNS